jgi:hypothetical protein
MACKAYTLKEERLIYRCSNELKAFGLKGREGYRPTASTSTEQTELTSRDRNLNPQIFVGFIINA